MMLTLSTKKLRELVRGETTNAVAKRRVQEQATVALMLASKNAGQA